MYNRLNMKKSTVLKTVLICFVWVFIMSFSNRLKFRGQKTMHTYYNMPEQKEDSILGLHYQYDTVIFINGIDTTYYFDL